MRLKTAIRVVVGLSTLALQGPTTLLAQTPAEGVATDPNATAVLKAETKEQRDARMRWWRDAKFGLFIHWGVYAVPAGKWGDKTSYGEWIMKSANISAATYKDLAKQFNPAKYDPEAWAQVASDAGMKYIVITAKHHEGFALFPSKASSWNVVDATPYGKDLLQPLVKATHAKGLKMGFYYSHAQDWINPGGAKSGFSEGGGWDAATGGSFDDYLKNVAVPQVRELLSGYPIDILWWDTPTWMNKERAAPLAALISLRPNLVTNDRLGGGYRGDTATPEQFVPVTGYPDDWETCMTINHHWGYNAQDKDWKSATDLIRKLADICSKGGNLLLNVGPTADGEFPPECVERLLEIGQWLKVNGDSIYGTSRSSFDFLSWGCVTTKNDGKRLYLHVFDWPKDGKLRVPLTLPSGLPTPTASLLATPGHAITVASEPTRLVLDLPAEAPDRRNSVIVLDLPVAPTVQPRITVGATVKASAVLNPANGPENVFDGTAQKRWRAPNDVKSASLEVELKTVSAVTAFVADEPDVWPRMKQQVTIEAKVDGQWQTLAVVKTNGHGFRKVLTTPVTAQNFRLTVQCEQGSPGIAELQLHPTE